VFSPEILSFMRSLDTPEVHGYRPDLGYRVYTGKALEIAATACPAPVNGLVAPRAIPEATKPEATEPEATAPEDKPKLTRRAQPKPSA
jgi:arginine decarboxylase